MRLRVLGPVELRDRTGALVPVRRRTGTLAAALALRANTAVPVERLVDDLWGERPPPSAAVNLRSYLSELRAALETGGPGGPRLLTGHGARTLVATAAELDLLAFGELADAGRLAMAGGDHRVAVERLDAAAGLWRGRALDGVPVPDALLPLVRALHDRQADVLQDGGAARLALGRHAEAVTGLTTLVEEHPLRERGWALLMLALYRGGRRGEAVRAYHRLRRLLADELGVEPGEQVQRLHLQVLRSDPELVAPCSSTLEGLWSKGTVAPVGSAGAAWRVPRQLPPDVAVFVGRAAQLARLDAAMARPGGVSAVALTGTAGVGKTGLAVRWAHRVSRCFPDGCLYADLRGYGPRSAATPAEVLARFVSDLGGAEPVPTDVDGLSARYRSLLAGRQVLVLLDNARDAGQVRPLLPGGTGGGFVLVTSRDELAGLVSRDGARRIAVEPLPPWEAAELVRELAGERAGDPTGEEPGALAELAAGCSGLPLALRLAADLVQRRPGDTLAGLAAGLADRRRCLDLLDAGGDPHTAVRAVFDWSYESLGAAAARAFGLLALHPGHDFDLAAASALTGSPGPAMARGVDELLRAHLLQPAGIGRYRMHDLLRAYGAERTGAGDDALTGLFDHYAHAAAIASRAAYPDCAPPRPGPPTPTAPVFDDPAAARNWLEVEHPAVLAAVALAAEGGRAAAAGRLAGAVWAHLLFTGRCHAAATAQEHARRAAATTGDRAGEAMALARLGCCHKRAGRFEAAVDRFGAALAVWRSLGDRAREADSLADMVVVLVRLDRLPEAIDCCRAALRHYRHLGDRGKEGRLLGTLAFAHVRLGQYRDALATLELAVLTSREAGDRWSECASLVNLGTVHARLGAHREALAALRDADECSAGLGNRMLTAEALGCRGTVYAAQGRHREALDMLHEALAHYREIGARPHEVDVLNQLGGVYRDLDRPTMAEACHREALELAGEIGARVQQAESHNGLGAVLLVTARPDAAREQHAAALALADEAGDPYVRAGALDGLGRVCRAAGDRTGAAGWWRRALAGYTPLGVPEAERVRARLRA